MLLSSWCTHFNRSAGPNFYVAALFVNECNKDRHRGISLDTLGYYLVFLDISILNIFTYFSILFSVFAALQKQVSEQYREISENIRNRNIEKYQLITTSI